MQRFAWLSAHIFTRNYTPELLDDVILDVVVPILDEPMVKRETSQAFFIRHTEHGPHVRLRIKTRESACARIRAQIETEVARRLTDAQCGIPKASLPDTALKTANSSLVFLPYIPEEVRYGGPLGLAAAEAFFQASSKTSFALLAAIRRDRLDRAGVGLGGMVAHIHGLSRGERQAKGLAKAYADSFGMGWVEYRYGPEKAEELVGRRVAIYHDAMTAQVEMLREAARRGDLPNPIKTYARAATRYRRRLVALSRRRKLLGADGSALGRIQDGLTYLAPSVMHMTTNRLGIDNLLECCLTEGLALAYQVNR